MVCDSIKCLSISVYVKTSQSIQVVRVLHDQVEQLLVLALLFVSSCIVLLCRQQSTVLHPKRKKPCTLVTLTACA